MPKDFLTGPRRDQIRSELQAHLKTYDLGPANIADFIKEYRDKLGGTVSTTTITRFLDRRAKTVTVGDKRVLLLERYMRLRETIEKVRLKHSEEPSEDDHITLFAALRAFFQMRPQKADQFRAKILGNWTFYAYSERGKERVCRGAIAFSVAKSGALQAEELQQSTRPYGAIREDHSGHFLFRKNSMIVVLREKQQAHPKFYVLSIEPFENGEGKYMVMTGSLLKVGAQKDVFSGRVHMIRNDNAFEECDVVPAATIDKEILSYLACPD